MNPSALAHHGAALLGGDLARTEAVSGGDLSQLIKIVLPDGREAIQRSNAGALPWTRWSLRPQTPNSAARLFIVPR
ncbi:MAG: hypothetical protein WDN04_09030 [Rhodospirillales bacterium]